MRHWQTQQLQDRRHSPVRGGDQGTNSDHYNGEKLSQQCETGLEGKMSRLEKS